MLLDTSDIIQRNRHFLERNSQAMENTALASKAIDVLRSACYLGLDSDDQITVVRLAIRLINSTGAAGDALMSGYYQPVAAQIRDIIEVGFLIDLFRQEPARVHEWRTLTRDMRRKKFSAFELRKALDKLYGSPVAPREAAYKLFTENGTHVDPDSIGLTSPNRMTHVGPFPDADRVVALSFEIARYLAAATEYFAIWVLAQSPAASASAEEFASHLSEFRKQVCKASAATSA